MQGRLGWEGLKFGARKKEGLGFLESLGNFLLRVPIKDENLSKMGQLIVNVISITNSKGYEGEGIVNSHL